MKKFILSLISTLAFALTSSGFVSTSFASSLNEPELNKCNAVEGITKCEVKCIRNLGEQCLVAHVNFEGKNLKPNTQLWRAKFLTCKSASLDLQVKSLAVELEKLDERKGQAKIQASVVSTSKTSKLKQYEPLQFDNQNIEGRISRISFDGFGNSGESFVEASLTLAQCGHEDGSNACTISGKFVAVTDPNIRCDFHDTTQSGAFRPPSLQISPSLQNSQQPIGRIGQ